MKRWLYTGAAAVIVGVGFALLIAGLPREKRTAQAPERVRIESAEIGRSFRVGPGALPDQRRGATVSRRSHDPYYSDFYRAYFGIPEEEEDEAVDGSLLMPYMQGSAGGYHAGQPGEPGEPAVHDADNDPPGEGDGVPGPPGPPGAG